MVRLSLKKENCKVLFYHIDNNFFPTMDFPTDAYILYPNYFGICDKNIKILSEKYPNLIVDNAHSFYSKPKGLACFNSARKFLKVYNGSYLWIKKTNIPLTEETEYKTFPKSESELIKNENIFNDADTKLMNNTVAQEITLQNDLEQRQKLFKKYHNNLADKNQLNIDINSAYSPFCYPYLTKSDNEADEMVKNLKNKGITIYRYWNELPSDYLEFVFYKRLVAIPLNY